MDEKALDALRNGLEDSYWYGDDDEKVFNELVRKAKAFDQLRVIIEMSMQKDSMYHYYDDHGAFGVDYEVLVEDLQSIIKGGQINEN